MQIESVRVHFWRAITLTAILFFVFSSASLKAQTVTGTILGNVLDSSGAVVPNAEITVTNQDTGVTRTVTSTGDGVYTVPALLAGKYTVGAKAQGFTPQQVKDIVLNVGSDARVNFSLQVGQVTQQVTVTEAVPTVETTSSDVSQVMDTNLINAIPLNARDLQQLVQVQPAVTMIYGGSYGKTLSVGGGRISDNRFLQEGVDMTTIFRQSPVMPTPGGILMGADAVKEFQVITENPSVEYGEESGGVISTIFKSGTNNFHGTVFEEYRNDVFDARNFFDGASAPPLHRHQFGGSIGGPIRKDKTFFYADYEGFHADTSESFTAIVPDALARGTGNGFGQLPCGQNGAPACTAAQIPGTPGALDTVTVYPAIYNTFFGGYSGNPGVPLLPACTGPELMSGASATGTCNLSTNPDNSVRENYGVIKIDHTFNSKNSLSGSYNMDQATSFEPAQTGITADDVYFRQQTGSVQETYILSTNVVNTFRFGVHRMYYAGNIDPVPPASEIDPALYVTQGDFLAPRSPFPQVPQMVITGLQEIGSTPQVGSNFEPRFIGYTSGNLDESVNWLRGEHAMHFGFQVHRWYDNNENYGAGPRGEYSFPSEDSFLSGVTTQNLTLSLNNYYDPNNGQLYAESGVRGLVLQSYGLYGEDSFKLKPNLTVTYGLRWEYAAAATEAFNRISNLFGPGNPPSCTPYTCAAPTLGAPYYHPPKDNFAPRLGFNWDPFKKGTTSVRASAGMFYSELEDSYLYVGADPSPYSISVSVPGVSFPFINVGTPGSATSGSNSVVNAYLASKTVPCAAGSPVGACLPTELQTFGDVEQPYFKTPVKYSFNFAIQQELPKKISFEVAYVGTQARHLGRSISYQNYLPTTIETPGQVPEVNGKPITYGGTPAAINPYCQTPGAFECYYWAGSGLNNANFIGTGAAGVTAGTAPYANLCAADQPITGSNTSCYNNPYWSNSIGGYAEDANESYNSLQVVLERRVSPGLLARFNYTFAKCITDSSFEQATGTQNGGSAAWPLSYIADAARGPCAFSPKHSANLTLTYASHWGNNLSSQLAKDLATNWELTSQTTIQSGLPFTITQGEDVARYVSSNNSSSSTDLPNWAAPSAACPNPTPTGAVLPNWQSSPNLTYLNPACFAPATPGYLGDIGNMVFTGPGLLSTDISLRKTIPIKEGKTFVFSADMFNAFNRTNFSPPAVSSVFNTSGQVLSSFSEVGSGVNFPTITTSRQFQISGRFTF